MGKKKVVVLGGGVAGLSAAHELMERGFEVEVFERQEIAGGKARSLTVYEPPVGGRAFHGRRPGNRKSLHGEHGFRFFPGFYRHIVETMAKIPVGTRTVADNLVDTSEVHIARFGKRGLYLPARFPRAPRDLKTAVSTAIDWLGGEMGLDVEETAFFSERIWQIMTSCEERRFAEYEKIDWWTFIAAEGRSPAYQSWFGNAITRSLVAAKAERASTKTIGNIFVQILVDILDPTVSTADRVLNGPTNEVWIDPWLAHLRSHGVKYHLNTEVVALEYRNGAICSATVSSGGKQWRATGDYYIAALPVERMAKLVTPELAAADPALARLGELMDNVEWMNGIQFYLTEDVPLAHGHSIYVDTPWALTSVSQAQFWKHIDLRQHGNGRVRGILSVDISDWDVEGLNGKRADACTREEIAAETWRQLKRSVNVDGKEVLKDEHLVFWFLDPDIVDLDPHRPGIELNLEPLLVNYTDTWALRPEATTLIPNLFLASDYVRTYTDLATMEAANEAARRAVNGVIEAAQVKVPPCRVWNLFEPPILAPYRAYDRERFLGGLPWDGLALSSAQAAHTLLAQLPSLLSAAQQRSGPPGNPGFDAEGMGRRLERDLRALLDLSPPDGEVAAPRQTTQAPATPRREHDGAEACSAAPLRIVPL